MSQRRQPSQLAQGLGLDWEGVGEEHLGLRRVGRRGELDDIERSVPADLETLTGKRPQEPQGVRRHD